MFGRLSLFLVVCITLAPSISVPAWASDFPGKGSRADWTRAAKIYNGAVDLKESGKYDDAIINLKEAVAIYPYDEDFFLELGIVQSKKGDSELAEKSYKQAISIAPSDWRVWNSLGLALYRQHRLTESRDSFNKALRCEPPAMEKTKIVQSIGIIDKLVKN